MLHIILYGMLYVIYQLHLFFNDYTLVEYHNDTFYFLYKNCLNESINSFYNKI